MTIRMGYLGTGSMGRHHVKAFEEHCAGDVLGVGFYDLQASNLEKALEILPDATAYDSAEALLASGIDAVVIATPNMTCCRYIPGGEPVGQGSCF